MVLEPPFQMLTDIDLDLVSSDGVERLLFGRRQELELGKVLDGVVSDIDGIWERLLLLMLASFAKALGALK